MTDNLTLVLKMFADFSEGELVQILACFNRRLVKKSQILLHEGKVCKKFYFIGNGSIRTYFLDKNGHEKTRYVMLDNHIGTALTSFINQKPSFEFIEALEDTVLFVINHADFYRLNKGMNN